MAGNVYAFDIKIIISKKKPPDVRWHLKMSKLEKIDTFFKIRNTEKKIPIELKPPTLIEQKSI